MIWEIDLGFIVDISEETSSVKIMVNKAIKILAYF